MENLHNSSTTIKNWAEDDKPREKLMGKGTASLSDSELLAILIRTGSGRQTAVDLAKAVLQLSNNNLDELGKISPEQLMNIKGIGYAKSVTIIAALELGRRRQNGEIQQREKLRSSSEIANYLRTIIKDFSHEVFGVVFLNKALKLLNFEIVSQGGMTETVVDPRIIFRRAIELKAPNLILCHNHPSGNLKPSTADELLTTKIKEGAKLLNLTVVDHIIVSDEGFFSFADEGLL